MSAATQRHGIALAMTGASGAQYGLRLLECLIAAGRPVHLMLSKPGILVIGMDADRPQQILVVRVGFDRLELGRPQIGVILFLG